MRWAHRLRRTPLLTARQTAASAVAVGLVLGGLLSAAAGRWMLAAGLIASLLLLVVTGLIQLRRRLEWTTWALRAEIAVNRQLLTEHGGEIADRLDRIEAAQRRVLASTEEERLAAAEFRSEMSAAVRADQPTLTNPAPHPR